MPSNGKPSRALLQARATITDLQLRCDSHAAVGLDQQKAIDELSSIVNELRIHTGDLEQQNGRMGAQMVDQGTIIKKLREELAGLQASSRESEKRREAAENDNNFLRDQLIDFVRTKAMLEGQIEILREFAPVPERDQYLDNLPRGPRPPLLHRFDSELAAVERRPGQSPWYHRRG